MILTQEVFARLPEFSCDEANNTASCVLSSDVSVSVCETAEIQSIAR